MTTGSCRSDKYFSNRGAVTRTRPSGLNTAMELTIFALCLLLLPGPSSAKGMKEKLLNLHFFPPFSCCLQHHFFLLNLTNCFYDFPVLKLNLNQV